MEERTKQSFEEYYEIIKVIGMGGYGCVYKGRDKKTKELRAIKVMDKEKIEENLSSQYETEEIKEQLKLCIDGFKEEFEIMKICSNNNNNSVKCYEYFNNENNFAIIMELCDQNLLQLLNKRLKEKEKGFNIEEIHDIMMQLNNTFKIMKENNIIHRDLKLENILIKYIDKQKFIIKLSDYGCSKRVISLSRNCNTYSGTLLYISPEILKGKEYNYKCDLWSIGVIIYRLIYGKSPYLGDKEISLINKIDKLGNEIIKIENEELNNLVKRLLEKDPRQRINWDEYFKHPFFETKNTNIINLIYYVEKDEEKEQNIFGKEFVKNNKDRIELMINRINNKLVEKYRLKKGENNIQIIVKNKLANLKKMFDGCSTLKNIDELKYLDTKEITNFSYMFYGCSSLSDIKSLKNWDVSNGTNFSYMFYGCSSLSDIKSLENWNVSNGTNFSYIFYKCPLLSDIKSLENWNVSNRIDFSNMFSVCLSLSDLKPLEKWNVSNRTNIDIMYEPELVKVVLLGESGVGKTSIISRFIFDKFNPQYVVTHSAQFQSKVLNFPELNKSIQFDIWDTVGQEKYRSLARIFYKDAKVIIFVYDITNEFSFKSLKDYWYNEILNNAGHHPLLALAANKADLYIDQVVKNEDGRAFADEINEIFQTTSAISDSGINTLFDNIGKKIINPEYDYKNTYSNAQKEFIKRAKEKNIKLEKKNTSKIKKKKIL